MLEQNALEAVHDDVGRDNRRVSPREGKRGEETQHGKKYVADTADDVGRVGDAREVRRRESRGEAEKGHDGEEAALTHNGEVRLAVRAEDAVVLLYEDDEKHIDELEDEAV